MTEFYSKEIGNVSLAATLYPDDRGVFYYYIDFTQGFEEVQFDLEDIDVIIESLQEIKEIAESEGYI